MTIVDAHSFHFAKHLFPDYYSSSGITSSVLSFSYLLNAFQDCVICADLMLVCLMKCLENPDKLARYHLFPFADSRCSWLYARDFDSVGGAFGFGARSDGKSSITS